MMKTHVHQPISRSAALFIGLATVCTGLIVVAENTAASFAQGVMMSIGSAIFGEGLAFFLIRIFQIAEGGNEQ
jgi:hypothetical protein